MKRTFTTLTTLVAAAAAFAGVPVAAAQTTQVSEPNYEFILGDARAQSGVAERVYEFQFDDGRSMSGPAPRPVVSYEFILERPAPTHAQMSAAPNYEFQLDRDGGVASSAKQSVYASTAAWPADTN